MRVAVVALVLLAACSVTPGIDRGAPDQAPREPVPVGAADTCGAAPHAGLIGQDATALERVLILRQVRVLRPSDQINVEFRPVRINFEIDNTETIRSIRCG